jgi:hypothetical protein
MPIKDVAKPAYLKQIPIGGVQNLSLTLKRIAKMKAIKKSRMASFDSLAVRIADRSFGLLLPTIEKIKQYKEQLVKL